MYALFVKRAFDLAVSILLLIVSLPVVFLVAVVILLVDRNFPFYLQERAGKNGAVFTLIKLRTMKQLTNENGELLSDAHRITTLGRLLRKTSIDELPQLWNVLIGEMSLVGPRPLLVEYLPLYNSTQNLRHVVRPGITGWAQVNGRNRRTWEEKFQLDVYYVRNLSFLLDLKIICLTMFRTIRATGISAPGSATAEKFTGNIQ